MGRSAFSNADAASMQRSGLLYARDVDASDPATPGDGRVTTVLEETGGAEADAGGGGATTGAGASVWLPRSDGLGFGGTTIGATNRGAAVSAWFLGTTAAGTCASLAEFLRKLQPPLLLTRLSDLCSPASALAGGLPTAVG